MMLDMYTSNDWIPPIVDEAMSVFEQFPQPTAIEIAAAVLKTVDSGEAKLPWATVFPSDDRSQVASRLLDVLHAPDYDTPAYQADTHLAVEELVHLLGSRDAVGILGAHAAYHLVQTAAGKENETFHTYQDLSRQWPQYATEWRDDIVKQFGADGYNEIMATTQELPTLLRDMEATAILHYENRGRLKQPGETTPELIGRALQFFDISTVEGLAEATRILGRGFDGYRMLSYEIRGLTPPAE